MDRAKQLGEMTATDIGSDEFSTVRVPLDTYVLTMHGGRIEVVGEGTWVRIRTEPVLVGRANHCALVLDDPTVSKMHLELQATPRGVHVVDLHSSNGILVGETSIVDGYLIGPCELRCGAKRLRFIPEDPCEVVVQGPQRFGGLVGTTPEMIDLFERVTRYARTDLSIVIQGETGTGKERVAEAIHHASPREGRRYLAVNCAAISDNLLEGELFGHVRGAFTGADRARNGLFVDADGGTVLFDEVGEMSAAMQAKLLRVLENQEVRAVGSDRSRKVNVRVLFATHVDLRHAVNSGRFREDLYYRIAQYTVEIPPLRKRLSDMRFLVDDILASLGRSDVTVDQIGMALLLADDWRGNVRQLRNVLQRALVESDGNRLRLERVLGPGVATNEPGHLVVHYDAAKEEFDRHYYTTLHKRFAGNISKISKAAGKQRVTVRTALRAFGLQD